MTKRRQKREEESSRIAMGQIEFSHTEGRNGSQKSERRRKKKKKPPKGGPQVRRRYQDWRRNVEKTSKKRHTGTKEEGRTSVRILGRG